MKKIIRSKEFNSTVGAICNIGKPTSWFNGFPRFEGSICGGCGYDCKFEDGTYVSAIEFKDDELGTI